MLTDEFVVVQMRIREQDPVDFRELAGTEGFPFVEAADTVEQSLAVKDFVQARDAAAKQRGWGHVNASQNF